MDNTWIVVADSAQARIFTPVKRNTQLNELKHLLHPQSRAHEDQLEIEAPDKAFNRDAPGRHAMSEKISPKKHEAWKLCKELADEIESGRMQGSFDKLVLVAPPAFLGELRKKLSSPASRLVTEELGKDLVNMDRQQIWQHLPTHLWD